MKVTVLMPVYNGKQHLAKAVNSILNQSYADFEFLIIDDGSTDGTRQLLKSFSDERIKLVFNKQNQGIIDSLNKGIELAKGEYIIRMDADDISLKDRISKQVAFMESHPDVGVCGTWVFPINDDPKRLKWQMPVKDEAIKSNLLFRSPLVHPTVIIRKDVLQKVDGYRSKHKYAEDYDLWVRLSKYIKMANIPERLLRYRINFNRRGESSRKIQDESRQNIILSQIKNDLKINPSQREIDIHMVLVKGADQLNANFYKEASSWLFKLQKANNEQKIFPQKHFNKLLDEYRVKAKELTVGPLEWLKRKLKEGKKIIGRSFGLVME